MRALCGVFSFVLSLSLLLLAAEGWARVGVGEEAGAPTWLAGRGGGCSGGIGLA